MENNNFNNTNKKTSSPTERLGEATKAGGRLIVLPKIVDPRGNLTVAEQMKDIPFEVRRIYWTYDIPAGALRGGHAHKDCREVIVAVSGSFTVTLDNGKGERQSFVLNRPYQGLYVGTGIWRTLSDFSSGSVCLVLAEYPFEEDDYIRNYDDYLAWAKKALPQPSPVGRETQRHNLE